MLGLVSLLMDVSSEIIHSLLPLFLTATLGLSVALVGLVDGVAESTASIVKVFSGYLSDRLKRRKPLILIGYGLGALSKPFFPLASGIALVLGARFADRIGKGIRGAPRDALIADVTPAGIRGRAYGLRQALDTTGAFLGPLLAIAFMFLLASDMRAVFWVAVIPAGLAVLLIIFGVKDPAADPDDKECQRTRSFRRYRPPRPRFLERHCHRRCVHAGALQRGIPDFEGKRGRPADCARAAGARGHEHRVRRWRVSGGRACRSLQCQQTAVAGRRHIDCRRPGARFLCRACPALSPA